MIDWFSLHFIRVVLSNRRICTKNISTDEAEVQFSQPASPSAKNRCSQKNAKRKENETEPHWILGKFSRTLASAMGLAFDASNVLYLQIVLRRKPFIILQYVSRCPNAPTSKRSTIWRLQFFLFRMVIVLFSAHYTWNSSIIFIFHALTTSYQYFSILTSFVWHSRMDWILRNRLE